MTDGLENIIGQALKNLSAEWQETRLHWRDRKAAEFEETWLEPLPHYSARAVSTIMELNKLLRKIREECE